MINNRIRMDFPELLPENIQRIHVVIDAKTKRRKLLHFLNIELKCPKEAYA